MCNRISYYVLVCIVAVFVAAASLAATARAEVVAYWEFNSGTELSDSSDNNYTLSNNGNVTFSGGNAVFAGNGILQTVSSLDLTPYQKVWASWSQKTTSSSGIVFEHSANFNTSSGAFIAYLTSDTSAVASLSCSGEDPYTYNSATYPVTSSTWENFSVEIDLAETAGDVVKVFKDGTLVSTNDSQTAAPISFCDDVLYIGARSGGVVAPLTGEISFLKIEGVPEPGAIVLLITGLIGLLAYAWRRRK